MNSHLVDSVTPVLVFPNSVSFFIESSEAYISFYFRPLKLIFLPSGLGTSKFCFYYSGNVNALFVAKLFLFYFLSSSTFFFSCSMYGPYILIYFGGGHSLIGFSSTRDTVICLFGVSSKKILNLFYISFFSYFDITLSFTASFVTFSTKASASFADIKLSPFRAIGASFSLIEASL